MAVPAFLPTSSMYTYEYHDLCDTVMGITPIFFAREIEAKRNLVLKYY